MIEAGAGFRRAELSAGDLEGTCMTPSPPLPQRRSLKTTIFAGGYPIAPLPNQIIPRFPAYKLLMSEYWELDCIPLLTCLLLN